MVVFFALAMISAAAPPATHAQLPGPIGTFISPLDYPVSARPSEGKVDLVLGVNEKGRVASCAVSKTSGSPILDRTACELLERRLKFKPAQTADEKATSDIVQTSIDWRMPPPELMARLSGGRH